MGHLDFSGLARRTGRMASLAAEHQALDTRAAAYADALEREGTVTEKVVAALAGRALTADEIADEIGESILTVRPAVTRLGQKGTLVKTALRRRNDSGKQAIVWMVDTQ